MGVSTLAVVAPSGSLALDRLDVLIDDLRPLLSADGSARVVLDLTGVTFVGPTAISLLVAASCAAPPGTIAEVRPPTGAAGFYMERMEVFSLIPCASPVRSGGRRTPHGFRECQAFASLDDCERRAPELVRAVTESCQLDDRSRQALEMCVEELTENIVFHADAPSGGFATVQTWPRRSLVEVGIVDLGRGVHASLVQNPEHAGVTSDLDALRSALRLGVTATPERNSGQGLYTAARLLEHNGGTVFVRSGSAWLYDGARNESGVSPIDLPGTAVALTIDTRNTLDYGRVARLIEELRGDADGSDDLFD